MAHDTVSLSDPARVGSALELSALPEEWSLRWPQSAESFAPGAVFFLQPAYIEESCRTMAVETEMARAFHEAAASIARSPALERLAWHCHWLLFRSGLNVRVHGWPSLPAQADPAGPMFYAVVFLSGIPYFQSLHRARSLNAQVVRDTLSDFPLWIRENRRRTGQWGFRAIGWIVHHLQGRLFALGRLQYLPGHYFHPFRFYRHAATRRVVALAESDQLFRADGQFASAQGASDRDNLWLSRFEIDEQWIRGNPISPWGHMLHREVALPASEWHEILRDGDPVMTVHIPATGPMDPESCGDSFRQAISFFEKHFPDWPFRAFTCYSWLLDPQFEQMKPPPENIVAFLREWYLHPVERASPDGTYERVFDVFGGSPLDIRTAPRDTSLRRAILDWMAGGGGCRCGGSVLFSEDLDWGNAVYRQENGAFDW
ncbi:MAG: DUF5596 domain-containing protein [Armatimonadetes bacterium]|nr:DUF5596 domain-containing protein [Armatimonadota bacterium]